MTMRRWRALLGAAVLATGTAAPLLAGFADGAAFAHDRDDPPARCQEADDGWLLHISVPACGPPFLLRVTIGTGSRPAEPEQPAPAPPAELPPAAPPPADPAPPAPEQPAPEQPAPEPPAPEPPAPTPPAPPPVPPVIPAPPQPRPSATPPAEPPPPSRRAALPPALPAPTPTPTPSPTSSPTPHPVRPSVFARPLERQMAPNRFADRRQGTDRRLVILVVFTGVISVSAVAALNGRARR
ncbi:hypothetical protein [Streptosporangium sp. NBC_01756]|uniref:hypothetical protein n=1 Tax=Streptosporangium sp. NBC_01756 TaxID=2975950 RepID=UPI002DD8C637|nr:hypothetical protein [Streptosporangium sp. NBC_01756]WSC90161.1 hypothetical protein OIE48_18840 [Streptosporangium sp. NBC_01756]